MKRYTVYNIESGMVVYVTEPISDEDLAGREVLEAAQGCAMTESLCDLQCRPDRQKYDAETGSFINTSTPEEQVVFEEQQFLNNTDNQ